jgi:hypothetical protein
MRIGTARAGPPAASPLIEPNGAGGEIRTHDLHLGKVALYHLSYARDVSNGVPSGIRTHVKGFADPRLAARPSVLTF